MTNANPPRLFYQIVHGNPPTAQDFESNAVKSLVLRDPTPDTSRWWTGISVHDAEESARRLARQRPQLGQFIAALQLPADGSIQYERTGQRRGHYTLWGEPAELQRLVVAIVAA